MNCPCGCNRLVPNNHYWATEECGKEGRKKGAYMPRNGEWRKDARNRRKLYNKKWNARKHGR